MSDATDIQRRALDLWSMAARFDAGAWCWQPFREGIEQVPLHEPAPSGLRAALLRYAPGASVPAHEHVGYEYILVLEGTQEDDRGRYPAGTLLVNPPGSGHAVRSAEGCVVLAIWERPVQFV
ncbi:MAG: cupin domain-containing protein [Pseudomonadota bacterium]